MTYSALELARAAGLFVVVDTDGDGVRVADGVAFVGGAADAHVLACHAVRAARPELDEPRVAELVQRLGHEYRPPAG